MCNIFLQLVAQMLLCKLRMRSVIAPIKASAKMFPQRFPVCARKQHVSENVSEKVQKHFLFFGNKNVSAIMLRVRSNGIQPRQQYFLKNVSSLNGGLTTTARNKYQVAKSRSVYFPQLQRNICCRTSWKKMSPILLTEVSLYTRRILLAGQCSRILTNRYCSV